MTSHQDVAVDTVSRSEMVEALTDQRRRMGQEYDDLAAELKRVREVAKSEIASQAKALSDAEEEQTDCRTNLRLQEEAYRKMKARALAAEARLAEAIKHVESADLWTDENYDVGDWREAARSFLNTAKEKT